MATLVNTIEELRVSSVQGAALAEAAAKVPQRHINLILGLHNIFTVLVNIGYLSSDQLAWPPHTDSPDFHAEAWSSVGLGDEARKLLPLLPYTEQYEADVMAPFAKALSYIGDPDLHVRDPRFNETDEDLLPPQFLRLSEDVGGDGEVLVYDTLEAKLAWWCTAGTLPQTAAESMRDLDWQPTTLLSTYAQRILELEWLPNTFTPSGPALETAPEPLPLEYQKPTYDKPYIWYINRVNDFRAREHIYRQHGWPGPEYDREQALLALKNLDTHVQVIEDTMRPRRPTLEEVYIQLREKEAGILPRADQHAVDYQRWDQYYPATQYEQARALAHLLQSTAGANALTSPTFEECHRSIVEEESNMRRAGKDSS